MTRAQVERASLPPSIMCDVHLTSLISRSNTFCLFCGQSGRDLIAGSPLCESKSPLQRARRGESRPPCAASGEDTISRYFEPCYYHGGRAGEKWRLICRRGKRIWAVFRSFSAFTARGADFLIPFLISRTGKGWRDSFLTREIGVLCLWGSCGWVLHARWCEAMEW